MRRSRWRVAHACSLRASSPSLPSCRQRPRVAGQVGQVKSAVPQKPDDRTIVHVLNRIGFGAAPGDIERVRALGLAAYIDQQLQPERIDDSELAARLAAFDTLSKSTEEMASSSISRRRWRGGRCSVSRRRSPRR